jgi:hypothetical protein
LNIVSLIPSYNVIGHVRGGHPCTLDPYNFVLNEEKGSLIVLQLVSCLSYTVLFLLLKFRIRLFTKNLLQRDYKIALKTSQKSIQQMIQLIEDKYPSLNCAWCVKEGLTAYLEKPCDY